MIVTGIKTKTIKANQQSLTAVVDQALESLEERSVVAVSSKIVALCEGSVVSTSEVDKLELVRQQADLYLEPNNPGEDYNLTIKNNTIAGSAGIDLSNADGDYVLWPRDSQASANQLRSYLADKFSLTEVGVVITDSFSRPLRRGATGGYLAFSGFKPLTDYRGQPDLFGRTLQSARADIASGIAAAATLVMGEGAERRPLAVVSELESVQFVQRDPTAEDRALALVPLKEDFFAQILHTAEWKRGGGQNGLE